jgi:hypothetical protein
MPAANSNKAATAAAKHCFPDINTLSEPTVIDERKYRSR